MKQKDNKKQRKRPSAFTVFLIVVDVFVASVLFTFYGPFDGVRTWYIMTALTSGRHSYLAYMVYDEDTVSEVASQNTYTQISESTDAGAIHFEENTSGVYASEYERQVLEKDPGNEDYKIIEFDQDDVHGYIAVIYDPKRLDTYVSMSGYGDTITDAARKSGATILINGGKFDQNTETGTCMPDATLISGGQLIYEGNAGEPIVSMNNDGVLVLTYASASELMASGTKWAVCFGPFFIVNGVSMQMSGDGGAGVRPRTAIGQRKDGIVLLLICDGAGGKGGATYRDVLDIMERYGAYNAANLDGGGSTAMSLNGQTLNEPFGFGYAGERYDLDYIIWK